MFLVSWGPGASQPASRTMRAVVPTKPLTSGGRQLPPPIPIPVEPRGIKDHVGKINGRGERWKGWWCTGRGCPYVVAICTPAKPRCRPASNLNLRQPFSPARDWAKPPWGADRGEIVRLEHSHKLTVAMTVVRDYTFKRDGNGRRLSFSSPACAGPTPKFIVTPILAASASPVAFGPFP